jgi:hypothetical protein
LSKTIDRLLRYVHWRANSQRAKIAELLRANDMDIDRTISAMAPFIGTKPLEWSENVGGSRRPLPLPEQRRRAMNTLSLVISELRNLPPDAEPDTTDHPPEAPTPPADPTPTPTPTPSSPLPLPATGPEEEEEEEETPTTPEPTPPEPEPETKPIDSFMSFVRKARRYWLKRNADGVTSESIGMRPAINGARMIKAGIPVASVIEAMTMHWPEGAADSVTLEDESSPLPGNYPAMDFQQETVPALSEQIGESCHRALPYIKTLAESGVPIMLIGTHGTGKTEAARQLALSLNLEFGFASMTEGTPPSTFYGRVFPEHVQSQFEKCYSEGGVFLFDVMDAAHPNLLLIVNAALANGYFSNTATGETIERHPNFVPVAAANTMGTGADRNYTGRRRLDAAALDRWTMGRVQIPIDETLEANIVAGIME